MRNLCVKPVVFFPNIQVAVHVTLHPSVGTPRVTDHCKSQVTGHRSQVTTLSKVSQCTRFNKPVEPALLPIANLTGNLSDKVKASWLIFLNEVTLFVLTIGPSVKEAVPGF